MIFYNRIVDSIPALLLFVQFAIKFIYFLHFKIYFLNGNKCLIITIFFDFPNESKL